jgi:hypothetical protein
MSVRSDWQARPAAAACVSHANKWPCNCLHSSVIYIVTYLSPFNRRITCQWLSIVLDYSSGVKWDYNLMFSLPLFDHLIGLNGADIDTERTYRITSVYVCSPMIFGPCQNREREGESEFLSPFIHLSSGSDCDLYRMQNWLCFNAFFPWLRADSSAARKSEWVREKSSGGTLGL